MKRHYVVHLEPRRCPAPLTHGFFRQVLFLDAAPFRASKMSGLAFNQVLYKFYVPLHLVSLRQ